MRELSLIAAIVAALAVTIVLAQEELKPAAPPAAAEPAVRANPFSPIDSGAAPPPWSASPPTPLETSPAQADAVSPTATAAAKLNGILYCESKPLVVINDLIAGVGDEVAGMRVTAIARDKVTLAGPRGVWVMTPLQPEARPAHPNAPGSPAGLPAADRSKPGDERSRLRLSVRSKPGDERSRLRLSVRSKPGDERSESPGRKPAAPRSPAGLPADTDSQAPEAAGGTPAVAAETTDQPIGEENQ